MVVEKWWCTMVKTVKKSPKKNKPKMMWAPTTSPAGGPKETSTTFLGSQNLRITRTRLWAKIGTTRVASFIGRFQYICYETRASIMVWLVVSTSWKILVNMGIFPKVGVNIKNIWNHTPSCKSAVIILHPPQSEQYAQVAKKVPRPKIEHLWNHLDIWEATTPSTQY